MVQRTRLTFASNELSSFVNRNYHSGWGTFLNLLWGCAAESMALSTCSRKKGIIRSSVPENNIIAKIGMIFLYWLSDKMTRGHTFISSLFMGVPGPPGF